MFILWLRRWLLVTVLAPLLGRVAHRTAAEMEARRGGPTPASRRLRQAGGFLQAGKRRRRRFF